MIAGLHARLAPADLLVGFGFVAVAGVEAAISYRDQPVQLAINIAGALGFGGLALRRVRPLLAITIVAVFGAASSLAQAWLAPSQSSNALVPIFALLVMCYSLGVYGTRLAIMLGAPEPVLLVLVVNLSQRTNQPPLVSSLLFFAIGVTGAPMLAGCLVRGRTTLVNRLRQQADQLEAQRAVQIAVAVASERLRVAEQLQLLLVHGMRSLTRQVADAADEGSADAVAGIEVAARALLTRTREVVVSLAEGTVGQPTSGDEPTKKLRPRSDAAQSWTVLAGAALCAGLLIDIRTLPLRAPVPIAVLACIVIALPLAMAWARPLELIAALWAGCALFAVFVAPLSASNTAVGLSFIPPFLVAALEPRRRAVVGLVVCCLGEVACFGTSVPPSHLAVASACWIAGAVLHERLRLVEQLRANNAVLDEQRETSARQAVLEQRVRIAHDLHDSVGHSLTVIALQAGAARRIWNDDPTSAKAALDAITAAAQNGLTELEAGLEVGDGARELAPVEELLAGARAAGLHVDAHIEDTTALGGDARLAVYRIVQEALTNILKHAPGATALVTIRNAGSYIEVVVTNTATKMNQDPPDGAGHGLRGMQRRAESCGGQLTWGRLPGNGFQVKAQLPSAMATT